MKITDNIAISNAKPVQINNNVLNNRIKNYIQDIPQDSFVKATPTQPTKPQNVSFGGLGSVNYERVAAIIRENMQYLINPIFQNNSGLIINKSISEYLIKHCSLDNLISILKSIENAQIELNNLRHYRLIMVSPKNFLIQKMPNKIKDATSIEDLYPPCYDLAKLELTKDSERVIYTQSNLLNNITQNEQTGEFSAKPANSFTKIEYVFATRPQTATKEQWDVAKLLKEYKENPTLENAVPLIKAIEKN